MDIYDYWRAVTIVLAVVVCAFMPVAIGVKNRPKRVWFMLFCIEMFFLSCIVAMGSHFGDGRPPWYRTPVIFIGSIGGVTYIILVICARLKCHSNNEGSHNA